MNNNLSEKEADSSLSENDFINYIDSEISYLETSLMRPGWTKWALMGSTGACVWLLFGELSKGINTTPIQILIILFTISFFHDVSIHLKCLIPFSKDELFNPGRFFKFKGEFQKYLLGTVWILGRYFAIIYSLSVFKDPGSIVKCNKLRKQGRKCYPQLYGHSIQTPNNKRT